MLPGLVSGSLFFNPFAECCFIEQNAATSSSNHFLKAVRLGVKDEVAESADWRPNVGIVPLGDRYEPVAAVVRCHWIALSLCECDLLSRFLKNGKP